MTNLTEQEQRAMLEAWDDWVENGGRTDRYDRTFEAGFHAAIEFMRPKWVMVGEDGPWPIPGRSVWITHTNKHFRNPHRMIWVNGYEMVICHAQTLLKEDVVAWYYEVDNTPKAYNPERTE